MIIKNNLEKPFKRRGYNFLGWYTDPECTRKANPGWKPETTFELYEKWETIDYPVTYHLNGGVNTRRNPRKVTVETGVRKLYPAKKRGHTFLGWYYKGHKIDFLPEGITQPVEIEARFSKPFTVSFDTGGGGRLAPVKTDEAGFIQKVQNPRKLGYTFNGWYKDPEHKIPFQFREKIDHDMVLYADWKLVYYHIAYHLDGGFFDREIIQRYTYESFSFLLPQPIKRGWVFTGWMDQNGHFRQMINQKTSGHLDLYACWKRNPNAI